MIGVIAFLGACATIFAAGFGLLHFLARWTSRLNLPEQFGLSWLLGTGVVSLLLWAFGFFLGGPLLAGSTAFVCIALPLVGWRARGWNAFRYRSSRVLRPLELVLATILFSQMACIFYLASIHNLGWDGLLNWEIKARYAFSNSGALPAAYFRDGGRVFSHSDYPLAIPFTELWVYFWLGEANQFWAKMIFPMFYAAGTLLLTGIGTRITGKLWLGLGAATLLFFVPQAATALGGSAVIGYADFPLSVVYLATIGYLLHACQQDENDSFRIYAACLCLLPWVKREGVLLWLVAAFCGALVIWRTKRSPRCLFALLPGFVIFAGWRLYLAKMGAVSCHEFLPISLSTLSAHADRIRPLVFTFASEFVNTNKWGLFWLPVGIAGAYLVGRCRNVSGIVLLFAILAPLIIYPLIYIFSAWPNYMDHVACSGSRLFLHVAPLSMLAISVAIASRSPKSVAACPGAVSAACKNIERERTPEVEFA
jgi:hypothetical protein